jgi:hypothetical protein
MEATVRAPDTLTAWEPRSRPQAAFVTCPVFEIFYGGSRGSLKTDGALGDWISHADLYGEHAIGLMVRRTRTELSETYERARVLFGLLGFKFNDSDHTCKSPNGARLRFAYLERDSDAEAYQGHSYTRVYVEEIGNFPSPTPIMRLMATLRSAAGVPCGFRCTGNPGGPGHHWVKARYIDPAPLGWEEITSEFENPWTHEKIVRERIFIPGRITDHNLLGPEYIANLQMSGSPQIVRAWLAGDWNVIAGAFFPEFSVERHVLRACTLPDAFFSRRFRAVDWGSYRPFCVQWWAVCDQAWSGSGANDSVIVPRGALVCYREWYGMEEGQNNVGLKMPVEKWAAGVFQRDGKETIGYTVADPAMWISDGGPSLAERAEAVRVGERRLNLRKATNKREPGWDQMRARLQGEEGEDGPPLIFFMDNQPHTIRTIQAAQHDDKKPEDIADTEDHPIDTTRYACMSRPRPIRKEPPRVTAKGPKPWTVDWIAQQGWRNGTAPANKSNYYRMD